MSYQYSVLATDSFMTQVRKFEKDLFLRQKVKNKKADYPLSPHFFQSKVIMDNMTREFFKKTSSTSNHESNLKAVALFLQQSKKSNFPY